MCRVQSLRYEPKLLFFSSQSPSMRDQTLLFMVQSAIWQAQHLKPLKIYFCYQNICEGPELNFRVQTLLFPSKVPFLECFNGWSMLVLRPKSSFDPKTSFTAWSFHCSAQSQDQRFISWGREEPELSTGHFLRAARLTQVVLVGDREMPFCSSLPLCTRLWKRTLLIETSVHKHGRFGFKQGGFGS